MLVPLRGVGGLLFFVCSLVVSIFSSALVECACSGKEKGVVLVAVNWLVGGLATRFACVSMCGGPCCVHPYILALAAACMCAGIPLALLVPLGACGMCVLWWWCALQWRVVPSFRLRAGVPHTMLVSSVRTA